MHGLDGGDLYPDGVEILLWLVPPVVVTALAMAWVGWLGRAGRGEIDRDEALRRMAKAIAKDGPAQRAARPLPTRDRSTGIAVRPSARSQVQPTSAHPTPPTERPAGRPTEPPAERSAERPAERPAERDGNPSSNPLIEEQQTRRAS
jgi:hypothetical protein